MNNRPDITDADLQDYIEGRLDPAARRRVDDLLAKNASLAEEVSRLRQQAVKLQQIGRKVLDEPIPQEMLDLIDKFPRGG